MSNKVQYSFGKENPSIIEAGKRLEAQALAKFEAAANSKNPIAFLDAFYNCIGHQQVYSKEHFVELAEKIKDEQFPIMFYKVDEKFEYRVQYECKLISIRPMAKYALVTFHCNTRNHDSGRFEMKFKYGDYFKVRKDLNPHLLKIVEDMNIPNNFIDHDSRRNIWEFNFKNINFLAKPTI